MSAEMATALSFTAAALKFSAVPAAAFELLSAQRRTAIEAWLLGKLPRLVWTFLVTLLVLYVSVALLVKLGPYVLLIVFLFGGLVSLAVAVQLGPEKYAALYALYAVLVVAVLVAAVLEKWVLPEAWILALGYPFEAVSAWASANPYVDYLLPDYRVQAFLDHFRSVFRRIEDWLWDWLAFLSGTYFFLARGVMVVMIAAIQLLLGLGIAIGALLVLGVPPYLFMKFSDQVRQRLNIDKDRIPVGAFFFWATGETIEFGMKVHDTFWR